MEKPAVGVLMCWLCHIGSLRKGPGFGSDKGTAVGHEPLVCQWKDD